MMRSHPGLHLDAALRLSYTFLHKIYQMQRTQKNQPKNEIADGFKSWSPEVLISIRISRIRMSIRISS